MFSLIVCSRNKDISEELKKNILSTIGNYNYEIVVVDNSENKYSIFQAYNIGVKKAKYKYLCFMHDDILFLTKDWGNAIVRKFQNPTVGMLGVAGGCFVGRYAMTWWDSGYNRGQFYDVVSGSNGGCRKYFREWPKTIGGDDVVAVDGLWMCIKRELFDEKLLKWDEKTYSGFHFYDLDMSMQIIQAGYRINIMEDLLIEHYSQGSFNKIFYLNCIRFHRKWKGFLPQCAMNFVLPQEYKEGFLLTLFDLFKGKIKAIANKWH